MAALLDDDAGRHRLPRRDARAASQQRLDRLAAGFAAMRADGYPVEAIAPAGRDLPVGARRDPRPDQRGDAPAAAATRRARAGAVPGVRPARGQRLVPHLGRRRLARRDRRRASRACGPRCRGADADVAQRRRSRIGARDPACVWRCSRSPRTSTATRRCARWSPSGWCIDPASAAVPRTYCQFGPLHTTLMRPFIALDPLRAAVVALSVAARPGIAVLLPVPGVRAPAGRAARRRAGDVRAGAVAAARAGVDDRRQRGAVPAALGLRARAAARRARRRRRLRHRSRVAGAAGVAGGGHALRRLAGAADRRCSRRGRSSAAATGARSCRAWRCSRCARRRCPSPGWPGARASAAIRCSSRTTS